MQRPYTRQFPGEPAYLHMDFRVIRVWQEPVETFLSSGVGLLPLAPLTNVSREALPFGEPDASTRERLQAITALAQLEPLADRLLEVENWDELLA